MQLKEAPDGGTTVELSKPEREIVRKAQKIIAMAARGISCPNDSEFAKGVANSVNEFATAFCADDAPTDGAAAPAAP